MVRYRPQRGSTAQAISTFQHSTAKGDGKWFDYADEFDVMSEYQDVWLALEVTCNDPSRYPKSFNMGWVRNLKVELA